MNRLINRVREKRNSRNPLWRSLFKGKDFLWNRGLPVWRNDIRPFFIRGHISELGLKIPVKSVAVERLFRRRIHKRYGRLADNIVFADNRNTVTSRSDYELSRGCQCCKNGTWLNVFVGMKCNLDCLFCGGPAVNVREDEPEGYQNGMSFQTFVETILEQGAKIQGISYSGGEPLLYLESRVIPLAALLRKRKAGIYQWLYTNGVLATPDGMKKLSDAGVEEIRVDLAATGFDEGVMDKLSMIRGTVGKVTVQVPSIPEVHRKLVSWELIPRLIDSGVELLNLQELYVRTQKATAYLKDKDVYYSRMGLLSPTESRGITADIMEHVILNKLPILVNDCSNDAVFVWKSNLAFDRSVFREPS